MSVGGNRLSIQVRRAEGGLKARSIELTYGRIFSCVRVVLM